MPLSRLFREFFNSEKAGGFILIIVTIISLVLANSTYQLPYLHFWNVEFEGHTLAHWMNDGFMTFFFLLIGLELEREIRVGELSDKRQAILPVLAAIGGMLVPATIFFILNYGTKAQAGAGIPMATDIAFAIGILSLLGERVPASLKIFLTALAVIDDLGAIIVIAVFYTKHIEWAYLLITLLLFLIALFMKRKKISHIWLYLLIGLLMWYCLLHSGVHATLAGVLLAFTIPVGHHQIKSTASRLLHFLHRPVSFLILPLFAMANTALVIEPYWYQHLVDANSAGIILGLLIGKPAGIMLFTWAGIYFNWCRLPEGAKWKELTGTAILGGIGFTMSVFITLLAFKDEALINQSKMAVIVSSLIAAVAGYSLLAICLPKKQSVY